MTTSTNSLDRLLKLDGAFNVRDIGGYTTSDGRSVQSGRLFRADGLHKLSEQDQALLLGRGIQTVIDLRHEHELLQKRNVFADSTAVRYHNVSLINPATTTMGSIRSLGDMYVRMLDECGPLLREVFELIANAEGTSVLFHCAAGKDRTGVVAALLMNLAGVPREAIVSDYAETEINLAPIMEELRGDRPEAMPEAMYEVFLGSAPSNMEQMLDHLQAAYGDAEQYFASIGLEDKQIEALRRKLLEA